MTIDIRSDGDYPGSEISNFKFRPFIFDGLLCASMEGLLQALKFDDPIVQVEICGLIGKEAKLRGTLRNQIWQKAQTLWWRGRSMLRDSQEYQVFLDRAFYALFDASEDFRRALAETGDNNLRHSIGYSDPTKTVLTEEEFCSRLLRLRQSVHLEQKILDSLPSPLV